MSQEQLREELLLLTAPCWHGSYPSIPQTHRWFPVGQALHWALGRQRPGRCRHILEVQVRREKARGMLGAVMNYQKAQAKPMGTKGRGSYFWSGEARSLLEELALLSILEPGGIGPGWCGSVD